MQVEECNRQPFPPLLRQCSQTPHVLLEQVDQIQIMELQLSHQQRISSYYVQGDEKKCKMKNEKKRKVYGPS